MSITKTILSVSIFGLTLASHAFAANTPTLSLINTLDTGDKKGTEIISIQSAGMQAAVSNSKKGIVDIYSLATPEKPVSLLRIKLDLADGEQVTSVAFHPEYDYVIAAIQASSITANGRAEIRDVQTGKILATVNTGVGPDAVIIDPTGQFALIPNEGEEFSLERANNTYTSADGSITLLTLNKVPSQITSTLIALPDLTGTDGFVAAKHKRFLERGIDWNQDGEITEEPLDLNGNGKIDKGSVVVGTFRGIDVKAKEKNGEMFMFPLVDNKPDVLEPEYAVFSADGKTAWVVLQENNGVVVIDTASAKITREFGLGITTHASDLKDDDSVDFSSQLIALREPDGITLSSDGRYLITADEGDTEPKASKVEANVAGGGRTISIFDAQTGVFLGDTQNQIDEATNKAGFYPESRSDNKGSEPEMVTHLALDGVEYAVASLERANGVALISLANPSNPQVVSIAAMDKKAKAGKIAPEGIAHFYDSKAKKHYIYTANEKDGTISIFEINVQ